MKLLRGTFLGLLWGLVGLPLAAETSFWLRNTDPEQLLVWWAVPASPPETALGALSVAPGGPHRVAPGERVQVVLGSGTAFLGAFVPWRASPQFNTPVVGGWILPGEVPRQGTVLVTASSLAAANVGRLVQATLQEWGLEPPRFVLGGRGEWEALPALVEWGPQFTPASPVYSRGLARPRQLQMVDREGALWLRLDLSARPAPGTELSLVLEIGATTIEWPFTGTRNEVWSWTNQAEPRAVGSRVVRGAQLEAWIPWDRLPGAVRHSWSRQTGRWFWVASTASTTTAYPLGAFTADDLP